MPPSQEDYCTVSTAVVRMASLSSTYFIVSMTFERFYSIIRPHKAASFNTVKRAKITIVAIIIFCVIYNIPHLYITATDGARCGPFGKAMKTSIGKFLLLLFFIYQYRRAICFVVNYEQYYNTGNSPKTKIK